MDKQVRTIIKAVIKAGCMEAVNRFTTYNTYVPAKGLSKILTNIGGMSIGYYVGDKVADKIIDDVDKAYAAYTEKEDIIDV